MICSSSTYKSSSYKVKTFGCRLNAHESEIIIKHLQESGASNTIVINTCAVTAEAERRSRQAIRRIVRENPGTNIVVTGCAAQINQDNYAAIPGVTRVVGNEEKLRPETWNAQDIIDKPKVLVNDIMMVRNTATHLVTTSQGRERAIVQVQQGCDHRCTFCVIPFGRGNSRSVPMEVVVKQVRSLVAAGYLEIVLSGIDITSYGGDLPGNPSLGRMVRRLLAMVPELPRLRLSSVDPVELDDDIWRLLENEQRFMPHLHLSLQSGDDMMLKRMKRRHLSEDVIRLVNYARALRPEIAFGADIIAGFPTETEQMHTNTVNMLLDLGLQYVHIFPYSPRPGTPATYMPKIHDDTRKSRAAELRIIGADNLVRWLDTRVGSIDRVLVERDSVGHGESFAKIRVAGGAVAGEIVKIIVTGRDVTTLIGERTIETDK
ncbi:RNA modification enzyme, MiaB family protein [Candidatus Endolissoclinum faulkneri L2]|uniref:RNA modification enzyme, MiaB family protein n=1 Tax=Candidatus Endolissoclinum faulkneri L2 TaxID=1193729 RepID=K7ZCK0_9PROT|nr:tRNA (N(6)-L-threonylcarbamoyladenosine(37)-C(2))-methylthiotransferase MtaB [Candidatus Endolissoclinum faulkneri]AFX98656.1 RNA modification enzyme, MiaB family protein [Candidatus Endolissoclinum faulkneri L2]